MTTKKKILVVEDEKALSRALMLKLTGSDIDVKVVSDGEIALGTLRKETFDLILLDLILPKKDGFVVLEELKARGDTTPVMVTTNLGQEEDMQRATALGARAYFVKSDTDIAYIVERVKIFLAHKDAPPKP